MKHHTGPLLALLLLTACGTADDDASDDTPFALSERAPTPRYDERPMSIETHLWAIWRIAHEHQCALAYRSLHAPLGQPNNHDRLLGAGSETACRNLPELLWYTSDAVVIAAVERGAYAYDAEEAARCIEAIRAGGDPLTWFDTRVASCTRVFAPLLGEGAPCSSDSQCGGALHCDGWSNELCTGRCAVKRCGDDLCERGEGCDEIGTRCVRRYDAACGPDLSACDGDLICQDERCTAATPPPAKQTAGGACGSDYECTRDLSCVEGRCAPHPVVGEGEACGIMGGAPVYCAPPLLCDSMNTASGRCIRAGGEGARCTYDFHCDHLHACREGRCGALRRLGELCDDGQSYHLQHCEGSSCRTFVVGEPRRCAVPPPATDYSGPRKLDG